MENFNFSFPVKKSRGISKYFSGNHDGIDIIGEGYNSPVLSVGEGIIYTASYDGLRGNYIVIKHENNIYTTYSHLNNIIVMTGTKVNKGEKIGTMGSTGMTTGVHLHFSVWVGEPYNEGIPKDPMNYISKK